MCDVASIGLSFVTRAHTAGVLDGGRIAHGLWGRRASERIGVITLLLLGLGGLANTLALFWALLVHLL